MVIVEADQFSDLVTETHNISSLPSCHTVWFVDYQEGPTQIHGGAQNSEGGDSVRDPMLMFYTRLRNDLSSRASFALQKNGANYSFHRAVRRIPLEVIGIINPLMILESSMGHQNDL